ncbi:MAG: adenine phosphoribosyltransferase [Candidatus Omnitrophica bacterium]|nr:adenine phosphoribosyltransferase [Candidatus Omnitrophota bacterium]
MPANSLDLKSIIRDIPDFPKKGILFKDITPLLKDAAAFHQAVDIMADKLKDLKLDLIAGVESRGFIFCPVLAYKLNVGFIPVRKKGKLPYKTTSESYSLEYGEAAVEIHEDAVSKGQRVAIVDDLLATGGTAAATARLIEKLGGVVPAISFLIELSFLNGREKLAKYPVSAVITY